ncbi:protein CrcB [Bradyrhizobium sp. USDA 4011]
MNVQLLAAVAIGGSLGSVARYLVAIGAGRLVGTGFPWGTLVINIVGSLLIGVFAESFALTWNVNQAVRVFLTVGICGGFTTFSTLSLDAIALMLRGELWPAAAYIAASVALSILALFAGLLLVRVNCQLRARPSRHPEERGTRVSKDARLGWWPSILRGSLRSRLRMTGPIHERICQSL